MSVFGQFMALAKDAYDYCPSMHEVYKSSVGTVNHEVELSYGNKISEGVANFVSTPSLSDQVGEANKALDYLVKNCGVTEGIVKGTIDYNQNIYDSLEMYKNTAPHSIPFFGEGMSNVVLGLGMMGIVAGVSYLANKYNNRIHI